MKRSKGITTYAIICIIYGLLVFTIQSIGWLGIAAGGLRVGGLDIFTSIIAFCLGCAFLAGGIGVLGCAAWARKVLIIAASIAIPNGYIGGIIGAVRAAVNQAGVDNPPVFAVVIAALIFITPFALFFASIIYFLTRPPVKAQFGIDA